VSNITEWKITEMFFGAELGKGFETISDEVGNIIMVKQAVKTNTQKDFDI
jgi:hypothetical protein